MYEQHCYWSLRHANEAEEQAPAINGPMYLAPIIAIASDLYVIVAITSVLYIQLGRIGIQDGLKVEFQHW